MPSTSPVDTNGALGFERHFTKDFGGESPFARVEWVEMDAWPDELRYFVKGIRVPSFWTQNQLNIVSKLYLSKSQTTPETDIQKMIERIAQQITFQAIKSGYFGHEIADRHANAVDDSAARGTHIELLQLHEPESPAVIFYEELCFLLLHGYGAFNSPVWFNVGRDDRDQQVSACFILGAEDTTESLAGNCIREINIFRGGSGAGKSVSAVRGKNEKLGGGGTASGPVSFMRADDAWAGTIKSGGKCLAPWQKVYTATGPVAVSELAELEEFITLSYDPPAGRFKAKRARAWKAEVKQLVEIVTDKGRFYLSDDHPVKLSTGEYRKAGDLAPNNSLFSCSIDESEGRRRVHLKNGRKGKEFMYRLVAQDVMGVDIDGLAIHHVDENVLDDRPSNLKGMTQAEHARLHASQYIADGTHPFQGELEPRTGELNGMHSSGSFWQDEEKAQAYRSKQSSILLERDTAAGMQVTAADQKMLNLAFEVLNAGYPVDTFDEYVAGRKAVRGDLGKSKARVLEIIESRFGSYEQFKSELDRRNHRVQEVNIVGYQQTYDVEVDCPTPDDKSPMTGHNFLIWDGDSNFGSGVIVANTRRAAKLVCLSADHPDIFDFIDAKSREEDRLRILAEAGLDISFSEIGERNVAEVTSFQNANNSVTVTDEFMRKSTEDHAVPENWPLINRTDGSVADLVGASDILNKISEAAHNCACPGLQFSDAMNRMHTTPVLDGVASPINSTNPCFPGETLVDTSEGKMRIDDLADMYAAGKPLPFAFGFDRKTALPAMKRIRQAWMSKMVTELVEITTDKGITFRCTPDHKILTRTHGRDSGGGEYVEAQNLVPGQRLRKIGRTVNEQRSERRSILHRCTEENANGTQIQARFMWTQAYGPIPEGMDVHHINDDPTDDRLSNFELVEAGEHQSAHSSGPGNGRFINADERELVEVYEAVENKHKSGYVTISRWNTYIRENGLVGQIPLAKYDDRAIRGISWEGFVAWARSNRQLVNDSVKQVEFITFERAVPVYDISVEDIHNFGVAVEGEEHSIVVSNCGEYMSNDDTSCNLASLNLMKFFDREATGHFRTTDFIKAVEIFTTAMDVLVEFAYYPDEIIGDRTRKLRQLGLGYANMGAILMANGWAYDSEPARDYAASITALLTGTAYRQSSVMAKALKPFHYYAENSKAMLKVIRTHVASAHAFFDEISQSDASSLSLSIASDAATVWAEAFAIGTADGYRNAQATVIAPTGTISFLMQCDTTGIEPGFSLVQYKELAGGGSMVLINGSVHEGLRSLGYTSDRIKELELLLENGDVDRFSKSLGGDDHLVFAGAGDISPTGHIKMMAAVQPFVSGSISKTINMDESATVADINEAYVYAWQLGVKDLAIYRNNSKARQVISTAPKKDYEAPVVTDLGPVDVKIDVPELAAMVESFGPPEHDDGRLERRRMPRTRQSVTHKIHIKSSLGENEGYIQVGMYPDGSPGELFVAGFGKHGGFTQNALSALATAMSIGLQYGIPLEVFTRKLAWVADETGGMVVPGDEPMAIRETKSIIDYIARWLVGQFGTVDQHDDHGVLTPALKARKSAELDAIAAQEDTVIKWDMSSHASNGAVDLHTNGAAALVERVKHLQAGDGPGCPECSTRMQRTGGCHTCPQCGFNTGCG